MVSQKTKYTLLDILSTRNTEINFDIHQKFENGETFVPF